MEAFSLIMTLRLKGPKREEPKGINLRKCLRPRSHRQQWPGIWEMQFQMNDSRTWKFIQNHTSELCFELKTSIRTLFPLVSPGLMSLHEQQGFLSSCLLDFYSIGPNGKSLYPEKLWLKPKTAIWKRFTDTAHIWINAETKKWEPVDVNQVMTMMTWARYLLCTAPKTEPCWKLLAHS